MGWSFEDFIFIFGSHSCNWAVYEVASIALSDNVSPNNHLALLGRLQHLPL